jgi:hypothetical protein
VSQVTLEDMFTEHESQWDKNPNYGTVPPAKKAKISTVEAKDGKIIFNFLIIQSHCTCLVLSWV